MSADERTLLDLTAAVSDGAAIDWDAEAARGPDGVDAAVLRSLRALARIAEVHRSQDAGPSAGGAPPSVAAGADSRGADPLVAFPSGLAGRWGPLELLERVGEGAFGEVFRSRDPRLDREVALKLLRPKESQHPGLASMVIREGRLLARVRHPNVATVYGAETHGGRIGIWMEFVRGRTLAQILQEHGPFGAREASLIGLDLCRALTAVHRAGVVHRDIKAQNVMREEGGRILLMDFGAGLELRGPMAASDRALSGTPLYMAPEVLRGDPATPRSDVYSLGVLLFHLVTRAFPVEARSLWALREKYREGDTKLLREARPDLPEAFVRIVEKALAPRPEDRFDSAGKMEQELTRALGTEAPPPPKRGLSLLAGSPWVYAAAGLAAVVIIWIALWKFGERSPGHTAPLDWEGAPVAARVGRLMHAAALLESLGDFGRARDLYEEILGHQEGSLGRDDPRVADTLIRLAWILHVTGDPAGAISLLDRALAICEAHSGRANAQGDLPLLSQPAIQPHIVASLPGLVRAIAETGGSAEARHLAQRAGRLSRDVGDVSPPGSTTTEASLEAGGDVVSGVPYSIEVALYRKLVGGRPERLEDRVRVAPGDQLFIEATASEPLYLYVANEDENGVANLLFPLPGFELKNPLPPHEKHRLPGRRSKGGASVLWEVDTAGGQEHFLVVASPVRLTEFESELAHLDLPTEELRVAARLSDSGTSRLRGISKLALEVEEPLNGGDSAQGAGNPRRVPTSSPPASAVNRPLFEMARQLPERPELARGVWIRQVNLDNPR